MQRDEDGLVIDALKVRGMDRQALSDATGIPYSSLYYILQRLAARGRVTSRRDVHAPCMRSRTNRKKGMYQAITDQSGRPKRIWMYIEKMK